MMMMMTFLPEKCILLEALENLARSLGDLQLFPEACCGRFLSEGIIGAQRNGQNGKVGGGGNVKIVFEIPTAYPYHPLPQD